MESKVRKLRKIINKDECESNKCKNGGKWIESYNGLLCRCKRKWEGLMWNVDVNEWENFVGKDIGWKNGEKWINKNGKYEC
jgi:hypothetical protein